MQVKFLSFACAAIALLGALSDARGELQVGAAVVDVTPQQLPVLVNGGMTSRSIGEIKTRINARAIVLADGQERIGIVVVDSCMMPRDLLDEAKQLAATRTQLKPDRILISATHTHSAPSSMGALGTDADPTYVPLLRQKLVEALEAAESKLQPAEVGWGVGQAPEFTALRRWVRRPDRVALDPFGNPTVRANMHAGRNPDDATGPTGPEDPELAIIGFRTKQDKVPIAALANFSMHYFSDSLISADYFGLFSAGLQEIIEEKHGTAEGVVAMMSHGCSGDIWRRDYLQPPPKTDISIDAYTAGLLDIATQVYDSLEYTSDSNLAMLETRLPMKYRVPDAQRLQWAQRVVAEMGDRLPKTDTEVYAREQILLHERQGTEIVLQALRIGDIAIATTPCETYALTGLKLKLQSPLKKTMVIELANGGDGYIPPPEQHPLGGYNTWPARSAGLEVNAEPRIVAANLRMLEAVCGKSRRAFVQSRGTAAEAILSASPALYLRLDEFAAPLAIDHSGHARHAAIEPGILFFLEGDDQRPFTLDGEPNRSMHFAGGRIRTTLPDLNSQYSVVMSFWNGMPAEARDVAGWLFSRDHEFTTTNNGLHLGLGGKGENYGKLVLQVGNAERQVGKTAVDRWSWHQVKLVSTNKAVQVFLDDNPVPEIEVAIESADVPAAGTIFIGGRSDNEDNWEGRIDEVAVFTSQPGAKGP